MRFINYAEESIHIEKQTASLYLALGGMGLFFIGRLAGGVIMNYIQPRLVRNHGVYSGYNWQYGDCLSHTAGMLWGDWRVCVIESPRSSLDKRRIFRITPSLFPKRAPPLSPSPFPLRGQGMYPPSGARNRCAIRSADHQRSAPCYAGWDRLGIAVYILQLIVYSLQLIF